MQRFYVSFPLNDEIMVDEYAILHQIQGVLRMKEGSKIIFFNGDGMDREYQIIGLDKKRIALKKITQYCISTDPKKQITLYQALPNKYEKIEYILQKGVEIGIFRFIFFRSDRSQALQITPKKRDRFSEIAREALEQSGGSHMPEVIFLDQIPYESLDLSKNIVLDTIGNRGDFDSFEPMSEFGLWVGPEGGWSERERSIMGKYGFIFARFGERILRTETAGIVFGFGILYSKSE